MAGSPSMARASAAESRTQPLSSAKRATSAEVAWLYRNSPRPSAAAQRVGSFSSAKRSTRRRAASAPPISASVRTAHHRRSGSASVRRGRSAGRSDLLPASAWTVASVATSSLEATALSSAWTKSGSVIPQNFLQLIASKAIWQPDKMGEASRSAIAAPKAGSGRRSAR